MERGVLEIYIADTVIFEIVFILQRTYKIPKENIRDSLLPLLALSGVLLPDKRKFTRVSELYVDRNLPFAEAYHAVLMEQLHLTDILRVAPSLSGLDIADLGSGRSGSPCSRT